MDIALLYHQLRFHDIVLSRTQCVTADDHMYLALALAGIGRVKPAITLLRLLVETADPSLKWQLLVHLHELTNKKEYLRESKYWATQCAPPKKLPLHAGQRATSLKQVSSFRRCEAFIHPTLYAYECILDGQNARAVELGLLRLVEVVGRFGPTDELRAVVRPSEAISTDLLAKAQHEAYMAAYLHVRHLSGVLERCVLAMEAISTSNAHRGDRAGALAHDKCTLAIVASEYIDDSTPKAALDLVCSVLVSAPCVGCETLCRRSSLLLACGHCCRALAHKSGVAVTSSESLFTAVRYERQVMLEAARKYALAAAQHPCDDPGYFRMYERIVWALLLAGGVDLCVLGLFVAARNHYAHEAFYVYAEPKKHTASWPCYANGYEVLYGIADVCDAAAHAEECAERLLPTILCRGEHVYVADGYCESNSFRHVGGYMVAAEPEAEIEIREYFASSTEVAQMWISLFRDTHGALPAAVLCALIHLQEADPG